MSSYLFPVLAFCVLSSFAVVMLSPTPAEELELSLSTMSVPDALAALNHFYDEGGRDPNLLLKRANLALEAGNASSARKSLERLAQAPEHALLAEEHLAQIANDLGDRQDEAVHLQRAYELAPSTSRLTALATSLRLLRRLEEEERLLRGVDPGQLPERLAGRLLDIDRTRGDLTSAEHLLRARINLAEPDRGDARGMLANLLIARQEGAEAAMMAADWFSADGDAHSLTQITEALLDHGFVREAQALAAACLTSGLNGARETIPIFATSGHGTIARALLAQWIRERTTLNADEQNALLSYMRTMNDYSAALALIRRSGPDAFKPSFVLGVVKGVCRRFGSKALNTLLPDLTPDTFKEDPLFAADVALMYNQYAVADRYLLLAAARGIKSEERLSFADLTRRLNSVAPQTGIKKQLGYLQ